MTDICICCGVPVPEGRQICPNCESNVPEQVSVEFICNDLAEQFGHPCNFSPHEDVLHETEERCEWCEKHCNNYSAADCWERYFQIKFDNKEVKPNDR